MDQQYTLRLETIEKELKRWLPDNPDQTWAARVFGSSVNPQLLRALTAPCGDLLSRGGKRWRPLLMTLVCEALGGGGAAIPLAPLVEFCHNASLIHDDIEDNSDERRGRPAVHILHGVDMAINSGSFLYFLPLACIDHWAIESAAGIAPKAESHKARVYALWGNYMRKLHLGQAMDIHWHRNIDTIPPIEEYHVMCALKTGCLARFAAELGSTVAETVTADGFDAQAARRLCEAAEQLGVGFQILDDVKNLTTGLPGKKRGDNIVEGKKSLPLLLFLHSQPEKIEVVRRCFTRAGSGGVSVPEVEELIQLFLSAGAIAEAEEQGKALIAEARSTLAGAGNLLAGFADLIS